MFRFVCWFLSVCRVCCSDFVVQLIMRFVVVGALAFGFGSVLRVPLV